MPKQIIGNKNKCAPSVCRKGFKTIFLFSRIPVKRSFILEQELYFKFTFIRYFKFSLILLFFFQVSTSRRFATLLNRNLFKILFKIVKVLKLHWSLESSGLKTITSKHFV